MIKEKLLSEVLGIEKIKEFENINIYELQHLCKVWAKEQGYNVFSGMRVKSDAYCEVFYRWSEVDESWEFEEDTEPEVVFKACEWILKRRK